MTNGAVRVVANPELRYSVQWADVLNSTRAVEDSVLEGEYSRTPSRSQPRAPTTTLGPRLIEEVEGSGEPPEIVTSAPVTPRPQESPCLACDSKFCWGPASLPNGNPADCQTCVHPRSFVLVSTHTEHF